MSKDPCVVRWAAPASEVPVRLGHPVLDGYLEFVAARGRPNTVLATASDLKIFFGVVGKEPAEVTSADVLGFITAQRTPRSDGVIRLADGEAGLSLQTIKRRLPSVSGLFSHLGIRGDAGVSANPVPRGLATRQSRLRGGC